MTRLVLALSLALFASLAQAAPAPDTLADPAQEARARALQKELRCLVCQGESLDESNAPLADDLRRLIRERLAAGDSDEAVKRYLVDRYGTFILMKPPVENDTYLLWLTPLLLILGGGAVLTLVTWKAQARFRAGSAGS